MDDAVGEVVEDGGLGESVRRVGVEKVILGDLRGLVGRFLREAILLFEEWDTSPHTRLRC